MIVKWLYLTLAWAWISFFPPELIMHPIDIWNRSFPAPEIDEIEVQAKHSILSKMHPLNRYKSPAHHAYEEKVLVG